MNISIVGQNIKAIRESKNLTAYKLAKLAKVGGATISEIESGIRQELKSETLSKIANALNVTTDDLINAKDREEYVVEDLEDTIDFLFSSDELTLKGEQLTAAEKELLKIAIEQKIDEIIMMRAMFKTNGIDTSNAKTSRDLMSLRNKIVHGGTR